jgi:hypothetical protein
MDRAAAAASAPPAGASYLKKYLTSKAKTRLFMLLPLRRQQVPPTLKNI